MLKILKNSWQDFKVLIKQNQIILYSLFIIMFLGIIVNFFLPIEFKNFLFTVVEEKISALKFDNHFSLFLIILKNNFLVLLISFILSFLFISVYLVLFINSLIASIVIEKSLETESWQTILISLLPHGIFEIPAFFISSFLSILFWLKVYNVKWANPEMDRWTFLQKILRLLLWMFILLFIAAFIEAYITANLLGK